MCVLLCFIQSILGNRYGPGVSSGSSQRTHERDRQPVKQTTSESQNLSLQINELMRTVHSAVFGLRRQSRNFENVTLVARHRKHFWGVLEIFIVAELPQNKNVF